ncbi:unnamed protein product [Zymoseptoria tritici ST99CH_3D1]|uniref:beta-glucosidase n=2 Tax=Zymoseptoria tritici TaxID=1047171 RepID=F9X8Z5_ZYMTI|nr:putative beta-glucosidase [Zymoseptoria tritici IPO323]EGP87922.1 putative beta-glucosidase [Zymoseptoria tritici IPO323]SMR50806.1 unnamed protein product [Zymoseptoria tritici ST99CH_1E4]SMR51746.1 unnamed protein product [Zymoseptoria tritici ST99CH_3D1]
MTSPPQTELRLPKDFLWGYATASYQIEGGTKEGGRGPSIWDEFCSRPGKIADGSNGDVACDSYHRYKEDVALLKQLGAKAYRFSISWSRVIPLGGRNDPVNEEGLKYYQALVEELVANNITPMVTLFHWDLPQALYERYGGFLNKEEYVQDFEHYSRLMFKTLGSQVKYWITYNEPWCTSILGYSTGFFAPGHTSDRTKSSIGDSSTEPWIVGHHILIAHAAAVKIYREEFQSSQQGVIGITLNGDWVEPWDPADSKDVEACQRKLEFSIGWFADPIYHGDYPASMRNQLGARLPAFTPAERDLIQGSNDIYGMNHYTADYVRCNDQDVPAAADDFGGHLSTSKTNKAGDSIGPETQSFWLRPHAVGFRKLLGWISERYGRPVIYVTENGTSVKGENDLSVEEILEDEFRAEYFRGYITEMAKAVAIDGVDVRGYMAWSLMDNFEWSEGYETRFGVTFVDYAGGQKRFPKKSARVIGKLFSSLCRDSRE